ncbi:hypothetical protein N431DRAFT_426564 [Stipitochalara longipes BDJ]|nr:hypothetical protein N431DRAFT_426564 [Stipitochalara longipes BDJ]
MPPKPFNPPRPSTSSNTSTAKKAGRPKGSTNKSKADRTSTSKSKSTNGIKKKTSTSNAGKAERERLSAASIRSLLPSLSPDTDEGVSDAEQAAEEEEREESDDPFSSQPRRRRDAREEQREEEDNHAKELDARQEKIGEELLGVILARFFAKGEGGGTRMSRDAVKAVGKYMDTFVREGVARAAWAGEESGRGLLEVEDLEKLAPQLLLDF